MSEAINTLLLIDVYLGGFILGFGATLYFLWLKSRKHK